MASLLFDIAFDKSQEGLKKTKHPWLVGCCIVPLCIILGVVGLAVVIGFIGLVF